MAKNLSEMYILNAIDQKVLVGIPEKNFDTYQLDIQMENNIYRQYLTWFRTPEKISQIRLLISENTTVDLNDDRRH